MKLYAFLIINIKPASVSFRECFCVVLGSRKFFSGPATKKGGEVGSAWPLRKKNFFEAIKKIKKNVATKLEGGG